MRLNIAVLAAFGFGLSMPAGLHAAGAEEDPAAVLAPHRGTYRGYGLTKIGHIGEMEAIIGESAIAIRQATGESIIEWKIALSDLRVLTQAELDRSLPAPLNTKILGLRGKADGYPLIMTYKDPEDLDGALNIFPDASSVQFGDQYFFYTPNQIANGYFANYLDAQAARERQVGYHFFPRFIYGGRTAPGTPGAGG
ncbi:MAG: hypothetical protein HY059_09255 [Proteobacteria bacterium]|nr:hypothetical protein [Pseudomonadota bacterium]